MSLDSDADDFRFKGFTAQVDKSLKCFEYSTEWADLISALGRLIKVIQNNSKARCIPRSLLVGKRLAQCLHPALPPGVHCKALECYEIIFRTIGPNKISLDLPIYGAGLFALLGPSAMAVKPPLFNILEEYLLPLGTALRPGFAGLLQGILPGLEQGAEFSERGNKTIEMFCASVGPRFFYTSLWKLLIRAPSVQHFGISFVLNHLNRRKSLEEQNFLYGSDRLALLRSLSCLLGDSVLLVQRDALDFLQLALPIHFHIRPGVKIADVHLSSTEFLFLCRSALSVLLRRDASLNRRLFTWLKGAQLVDRPSSFSSQPISLAQFILRMSEGKLETTMDLTKEHELIVQDEYFNLFSQKILTDAVRQVIDDPSCLPLSNNFIDIWGFGMADSKTIWCNLTTERNITERPFRIVAGLLDRSDVGGLIIEDLLLDILRYTYTQFHFLKQRSHSWMNADSRTIISGETQGDFRCNSKCAEIPNDVWTLIADYVNAKDSTRSQLRVSTASDFSSSLFNDLDDSHKRQNELSNVNSGTSASVSQCTPCMDIADDFLRTAHLFLSNLDGTFLWKFIETVLEKVIAQRSLLNTMHSCRDCCCQMSLNTICRIMHFLITHLPLDTYPGVCGFHLPRLASHILVCLTARVQLDATHEPFTAVELTSVLCLLNSLTEQISKFVLSMFDRSAVFSLGSTDTTTQPPDPWNSSSNNDLYNLASMIAEFRQFLGIFCIHILKFSTDKLSQFVRSIRASGGSSTLSNDSFYRSTSDPSPACSSICRKWIDLFSKMCHLLLQMSNFPLLILSLDDPFGANEHQPDSLHLMSLFCGHLRPAPEDHVLPDWLVCLLYAAAELDYFDMKAISLYTLLELFSASTSINGWGDECDEKPTSEWQAVKENASLRMRLIFPVLSGSLLSYLLNQTNIFVRIGISLWDYLSPSNSAYHDDSANLLLRLHQLAPTVSSSFSVNENIPPSIGSVGSVVEAFILSQMLSSNLRTQVDAQARFALLWHLMRPNPIIAYQGELHPTKSILGSFCGSIASPCWRRLLTRSVRCNINGLLTHDLGHRSFPFYRCVLLLLDNLDFDNPWGPVGPVGSAGFSSYQEQSLDRACCVLSESTAETQITGLVKSVLQEQSVQWVKRALRTGQVDRLLAPVFAVLLHPATARVSLKARVIQANQRYRHSAKQATFEQEGADVVVQFPDFLSSSAMDNESGVCDSSDPVNAKQLNGIKDCAQRVDLLSVLRSDLDQLNAEFMLGENKTEDLQSVEQRIFLDEEPPSMLPLHEHLLVHLQNYDANQVVYALSRLRAILFIAPDLLVSALSVCPVANGASNERAGANSYFGLSLLELLTRHQRALTGGNFYGTTSAEESARTLAIQTSLLDVIVNLCISIMCSQLPYASVPPSYRPERSNPPCVDTYEFGENEYRANKCAQKAATDVLELIVKELARLQNLPLHSRTCGQQIFKSGHNTEPCPATFTGRRLVEDLVKRTCLTSVVLHCLATSVEVAHWPSTADLWLTDLSAAEFKALPMCVRLLLVNELSAKLPSVFHSVHLSSLIRLTQAVLQLHPWCADRIESTVPKSLMPNVLWPCETLSDSVGCKLPETIVSGLDYDCLSKIWFNAFQNLPILLARLPIFQSVCLSVHWKCPQIQSSHPVREQAALLIDVLSLALSSPCNTQTKSNQFSFVSRRDLHSLWYQFVFTTLGSWGLFTPSLVRVVVGQICSNLLDLAERALNKDNWSAIAHLEASDLLQQSLPPDYTLVSLACLQGIYHAILLPGVTTNSSMWSKLFSSSGVTDHPYPYLSASEIAGFPHTVVNASSLADKLIKLMQSTNTKPSVVVDPDSVTGIQTLVTPRIIPTTPSTIMLFSNSADTRESGWAFTDPDSKLSILNSVDNESGAMVDVQASFVSFTNRPKDFTDSADPDSHPLIQAQIELFRQLPTVLIALALLWDVYNQLPSRAGLKDDSVPPDIQWPADMYFPLDRLPSFAALGTPDLLRPALRMFIEPIARHHPAPFLVNLAIAWPPTLHSLELGASFAAYPVTLLSLLNPKVDTSNCSTGFACCSQLPLLPRQKCLLRLLSGCVLMGSHFDPVLPIKLLVNQLREIVRRPYTYITVPPPSPGSSDTEAATSKERDSRLSFASRLQVNLLHMFYALLVTNTHPVSSDLLLPLLRDLACLPVTSPVPSTGTPITITPVAIFILVKIFNILLNVTPTIDDRREQRELQELCHRLLESTAAVAASALKQPTWFRRALQVPLSENESGTSSVRSAESPLIPPIRLPVDAEQHNPLCKSQSIASLTTTVDQFNKPQPVAPYESFIEMQRSSSFSNLASDQNNRAKCNNDLTVQAMELLTEHMAGFLDTVYRSDEKDRVPTFLTGLLSIIFPYLRVRIQSNSDRFTAASKILASLSGYQYTRRAWRREVLDLFFEPSFFQMNLTALQSWKIIIDNLMTQDKNTFREAFGRLAFSQPGTLNLFSSKETEHELRAACLKKLSYLVYCSEPDQYAKSMPDLLERLTECLRLSQGIVPQVHAQVFVFARTLISRMSPVQLTSLWPIVIPEMILVFKCLSTYLRGRCEESKNRSTSTELPPKDRSMYLSVCKLLAAGILIPELRVPQFLFYQWIFLNQTHPDDVYLSPLQDSSTSSSIPSFIPLLSEVSECFQILKTVEPSQSTLQVDSLMTSSLACLQILSMKALTQLSDLAPFVYSLENSLLLDEHPSNRSQTPCDTDLLVDVALEAALAHEFPEPVTSR